ncbi:MAG: hypothetical protein ACRD3W_11600 [Terriglobales bacterium]
MNIGGCGAACGNGQCSGTAGDGISPDLAAMAERVRQAAARRTTPVRRRARECRYCPSLGCPGCPKMYGADGQLLAAALPVVLSEPYVVPADEAHYPPFVQDILRRTREANQAEAAEAAAGDVQYAPFVQNILRQCAEVRPADDAEGARAIEFVEARMSVHAVRRRLEEAAADESSTDEELDALVSDFETAVDRYVEAENALNTQGA